MTDSAWDLSVTMTGLLAFPDKDLSGLGHEAARTTLILKRAAA